jgi:hypothetical protein
VVWATRGWSGGAVDGYEVVAERHCPAGVVERDRPCPTVAAIDVRHPVRMPVVVDDVAGLKIVGVNRGHRVLPSNGWQAGRVHIQCHQLQEPVRVCQIHAIGRHHGPDTPVSASGRARAHWSVGALGRSSTGHETAITAPPVGHLRSRSRAATRRWPVTADKHPQRCRGHVSTQRRCARPALGARPKSVSDMFVSAYSRTWPASSLTVDRPADERTTAR